MQHKCFLDMDGVIADFMSSLLRVHNRPNPYVDPANRGVFDTEQLWGISSKEFWAPVAKNSLEFWTTIDKTPEADQIVELVCREFGTENVALLTAPSSDPGSIPGKKAWVKRHFPQFHKRMIFATASTKQFMAGPGKFLVDDKTSNVDEFDMAGGNGILVPRPWNILHALENDLMSEIHIQIQGAKRYGK